MNPRQHPESVHGPRTFAEDLAEGVHQFNALSKEYLWPAKKFPRYGVGRLPGEPFTLTDSQVTKWRKDR